MDDCECCKKYAKAHNSQPCSVCGHTVTRIYTVHDDAGNVQLEPMTLTRLELYKLEAELPMGWYLTY